MAKASSAADDAHQRIEKIEVKKARLAGKSQHLQASVMELKSSLHEL